MKNRLIYENLDTSFVNLAALVRFLRARDFEGNVRIELDEYQGEIFFTIDEEPSAREHDRVSGRSAEGAEALRRLLIRAREPGGVIHVYQNATSTTNLPDAPESAAVQTITAEREEIALPDISVSTSAPIRAFHKSSSVQTERNIADENGESFASVRMNSETKSSAKSLELPFEFSNQVETKARQTQLSEADWQALLLLTAELLGAIDDTLASNKLNFPAAFQKARAEIADDYPFLDPNKETFVYRSGKIEMREQVNAKVFAAGVNETLRRILEKLAANSKFAEPYRETTQKILALVRRHKSLYDRFFITPQLEKILGV